MKIKYRVLAAGNCMSNQPPVELFKVFNQCIRRPSVLENRAWSINSTSTSRVAQRTRIFQRYTWYREDPTYVSRPMYRMLQFGSFPRQPMTGCWPGLNGPEQTINWPYSHNSKLNLMPCQFTFEIMPLQLFTISPFLNLVVGTNYPGLWEAILDCAKIQLIILSITAGFFSFYSSIQYGPDEKRDDARRF